MSAEEKQLLATKAHCQMLIEQCDKRLKMLQVETTGAVSTATRKARGVSVADRERAKARMQKRFTQK